MRKNTKTCIYVVTAILPIVLSACSNKNNNMPKSTKESATTTFVEDTSSDIVSTIVETSTEEDTTELISETEQEVINSTENITEQQQTQVNVQQTTTVTSVNSTPAPVQTTPRPTETDQTTPIPTDDTTPGPITPDFPIGDKEYKIKDIVGIGEKYSYKGKEFRIDEIAYGDVPNLSFIINISVADTFTISQLPFKMYCRYDIYNSSGNCVKTGYFKFTCNTFPDETTDSSSTIYLTYHCNSAFIIDDLPCGEFSIVFSNYE